MDTKRMKTTIARCLMTKLSGALVVACLSLAYTDVVLAKFAI